ncbi:PREDICTED: uncharacterized protein LOC100641375 [Amphimedon queenslandica]|uniref:Uncharacterized protein n=1 Tax=Amphimedon queenslandica TaxID=400682 RepID=A0A1X7V1U9_AMPQE|nr:PREDICTED: uncharacterized protein LOC100641375 [Amphimedon queenslandica]|eukprot:XP_003386056.1 PREDICTED: uncharacterized protein LOC100641375 [Amphimedon queenslandica]
MGNQNLGIALGAAALVIALFLAILFIFVIIMLVIHFNKKLRKMREYLRKERKLREREEGLVELNPCSPHHFNNSFEAPSPSKPVTVVVHATNQTFAETPLGNQSLPTSPAQAMAPVPASKAWSDNGQYTDLTGPLPGFLRNEEMLLPPEATPELVAAAQVINEEKEEEEESKEVKKTPVKKGSDDYVNPLDAKTEAAAMRQKEKIKQKVSQGLQQKRTSDPQHSLSITDDGNYTIVSDALPKGDFERIEVGNSSSRSRAYSDIDDPKRKSSHVSGADSGKGSNTDSVESESPTPQIRFHSTREKPKHLSPQRPANEVKSNPIPRRRSMAQHKEEVSFDPNTGFKLSAKRTNSDGSPAMKQKRSEGQRSPVSDPGHEFPAGSSVTDERFVEGGGVHAYATVDLKAKCRPEDDILRREGVGAPEHYNAPVPCN